MAFNSETVVKAIFESAIPVISAVGHEIDFSLADLAADLRAATPTQAASLAVPDIRQLNHELMKHTQRMKRLMEQKLGQYSETLDRLMLERVWKEPDLIIKEKKRKVAEQQERMNRQMADCLQLSYHRYSMAVEALDKLSPLKVLKRGYAVAYKKGSLMTGVGGTEIGDYLDLVFNDGKLGVVVGSKEMVADEKNKI
jgi:exodeoxyribonuclease VII large subunit